MDNFEVRYRAIVEKRGELWHDDVRTSMTPGCWVDDNNQQVEQSLARAAVCWWLERKAIEHFGGPQEYWKFIVEVIGWGCYETDPQDVVLTVQEIILGIKEKA